MYVSNVLWLRSWVIFSPIWSFRNFISIPNVFALGLFCQMKVEAPKSQTCVSSKCCHHENDAAEVLLLLFAASCLAKVSLDMGFLEGAPISPGFMLAVCDIPESFCFVTSTSKVGNVIWLASRNGQRQENLGVIQIAIVILFVAAAKQFGQSKKRGTNVH
jgi:hypothetical protein